MSLKLEVVVCSGFTSDASSIVLFLFYVLYLWELLDIWRI
jgi:hypothetical protein